MIYALLRAIAGVALRWYYSDIEVAGTDRIPRDRPLLVVVNHPNALVDALLVGWVMPRRVLITAKATLFKNPVAGKILRWLGVLPLRRISDEAGTPAGATRNVETFRAVHEALARRRCVLIFPEGKTPEEPSLAPLKSGAARMALHARESGDVPGLAIQPIGLVFEQKELPRSRVFVEVGEPLLMEEWRGDGAQELTRDIETRLRALTLSYPTADTAARAMRFAAAVASLLEPREYVGERRGFAREAAIAHRVDALRAYVDTGDTATQQRAAELLDRLNRVERHARAHGVALDDARIALGRRSGARFVVRETLFLLIAGPVAVWGRINHWLPFRAARFVAVRRAESTADPAMGTIVAGAAFVLATYIAQTLLVWWVWSGLVASIYLMSLPVAAEVNFWLSDRLRRVARRARAYLVLRRDAALRERLAGELSRLRSEIVEFDRAASR